MPVDAFVAVAFDDRWYLGQVAEIMSPEEAKINYMKDTKAIYLLEDGISIAPGFRTENLKKCILLQLCILIRNTSGIKKNTCQVRCCTRQSLVFIK